MAKFDQLTVTYKVSFKKSCWWNMLAKKVCWSIISWMLVWRYVGEDKIWIVEYFGEIFSVCWWNYQHIIWNLFTNIHFQPFRTATLTKGQPCIEMCKSIWWFNQDFCWSPNCFLIWYCFDYRLIQSEQRDEGTTRNFLNYGTRFLSENHRFEHYLDFVKMA